MKPSTGDYGVIDFHRTRDTSESIRCVFNGELSFDLTGGGVMSEEILLDIAALGISLAEFEHRYLR